MRLLAETLDEIRQMPNVVLTQDTLPPGHGSPTVGNFPGKVTV
jgi:hypothetical protein